jgi:hypothetical protein
VRPLDALERGEAAGLVGVAFDLDDTVLDRGKLDEPAYSALFRLRESGLRLLPCTGRPAGWGEIVQRQWPVDATVTENGAVVWTAREGRLVRLDRLSRSERAARRAELLELGRELCARHPEVALADDNDARASDVTLDIGEHRRAPPHVIEAIRAEARARGVRTAVSSVHLHLTRDPDDKASGVLRAVAELFDEDATAARRRWAFVGDSGNDAAAFAAFHTTFGVANVRDHLGTLTVPPRYIAKQRAGAGFAEIATRLVSLRRS